MSAEGELLVGLCILIGIVGIIVPILPGSILILAAIGFWAWMVGTGTSWLVFGIAAAILVITAVIKYTWPGQKMRDAGVPTMSIVVGALFGIVGFFVIPVLGLFIGFVLGVFIVELGRSHGAAEAWDSTWHAVKAVALSTLLELLGALLAAGIWLGAVILT